VSLSPDDDEGDEKKGRVRRGDAHMNGEVAGNDDLLG
jgi:hypothetical protein